MKKILTIIVVLLAVNSQAQIQNATLQASGLTCAMCSKAVYKALSDVAFVEKVKADIENLLTISHSKKKAKLILMH
jgi:copper chaperone CopZ